MPNAIDRIADLRVRYRAATENRQLALDRGNLHGAAYYLQELYELAVEIAKCSSASTQPA